MPSDELGDDVAEIEADGPDDLDDEELEDLDEGADDDDIVVDDEDGTDDDDVVAVIGEVLDPTSTLRPATEAKAREDDDDDDDDDEEDSDDIEASLDVILKERLVVNNDEDDDEEETVDADDRGDPAPRVLPKQPGEFVCQSCFLVKHPSQLADRDAMFCRDCV